MKGAGGPGLNLGPSAEPTTRPPSCIFLYIVWCRYIICTVVPVPTENNMRPAFPFVAAPVTNRILPDDPDEVVPVENEMLPLTPFVPESGVLMTTEPLHKCGQPSPNSPSWQTPQQGQLSTRIYSTRGSSVEIRTTFVGRILAITQRENGEKQKQLCFPAYVLK